MIPVTKPFLPPREEYELLLDGIWSRNWLTNNGPLVQELETQLLSVLNVPNILFLGNGTIALQMAIKALDLKGEIITTPFSYVATTSTIVWEGCIPVFVDIDPNSLNIDPAKIEASITENTSAILATHVYGNPCDVEEIDRIAKRHGLKVIYDGAHCFGTTYKGKSIFTFGDIVTTSFHATKIFHTVEGGAVFTNDDTLHSRMSYIRNFGHDGPERFNGVGINAKNSEFHAAMGLVVLKHMDEIKRRRKYQSELYHNLLDDNDIKFIQILTDCTFNYAYFPIILNSEKQTVKVIEALHENDIFPRRYFYPSLSRLEYLQNRCDTPICDDISSKVLCLPMYYELEDTQIQMISQIIIKSI